MGKYLYDDYILRLSQKFNAELESIKAIYNFDLGDEYEIAICKVLRQILPIKYGICRGFAVAEDGSKSGDDIIIYDSNRYPSLGIREYNDFSRKEFIPAEAIYCYIEAKYTLDISDSKNNNLKKALKQVDDVKSICNKRESVEINHFDDLVFPKIESPWDYPPIKNKSWGAIFCSRIKFNGNLLTNPLEIEEILRKTSIDTLNKPDLLIFGRDLITIPVFIDKPKKGISTMSYFHLNGLTSYKTSITKNIAVGIGICQLLGAIDRISLGKIKWNKIVLDGITKSNSK
jgi:hypothetical protein